MSARYLLDTNVVSEPLRPVPNAKVLARLKRHLFSYDQAAAEWHAAERARLTALGKTPPFADGQIMAIAQTNSLTLVTLNPSDYEAFTEVKVEDWSR